MAWTDKSLRVRFWVEAGLAALTAVLTVVTLFWHDWLEAFGFDPDHGDGSVEWMIIAGMFVLTAVFVLVARLEWRRSAAAY